jgi:Ca-activated chloride channel homolog
VTLGVPTALWGLAVIPLLVALYLLRTRRREYLTSSVLLWRRAMPPPAASRLSRRIERSVLLLLQLLTATALVVALARPAAVGRFTIGGDVVLILDGSLSMRSVDVFPTRFDRARAEALALAAHLRPGQRAAVVLAGPKPLLLSPLSDDRGGLLAALRRAEAWDTVGDVGGAVGFAAALLRGGDGHIVVWTDAARGVPSPVPRVTYHLIGTSDDNVGITAFRVLRDAPASEALVRVHNFGSRDRQVPLDLRRDGVRFYRTVLSLPAGSVRTIVVPVNGSGILQAHIAVHDALPEDDTATAVLDPAPLPPVLLVTTGNPYLERLLRVMPIRRAAKIQAGDPAGWSGFGIVILDRLHVGSLPPGNYLLIGTAPPNLPLNASGMIGDPGIATWDRFDPILRFVDLSPVQVRRTLVVAPEGGRVLAEGQVPLIWAYEGAGLRVVWLGFALEDSDLPLHVAFPVLMANSLSWLAGTPTEDTVGDTLEIPAGNASWAEETMPGDRRVRVPATDGMFVLPPFDRAGLYRLTTPAGERRIAVTIGSERAGSIRPGLVTTAPAVQPASASRSLLASIPFWPWFLVAAVAAAAGEWMLATQPGRSEP